MRMKNECIKAHVDAIMPLTDSILQLVLAPQTYVDYQAGHYLQILLGDEALSYSIANAPLGSRKYELHIRHSPDNRSNQRLLEEIKQKGMLTIRVPLGECEWRRLDPVKPILFIAAGTGFAPIKAMIEQLLADGTTRVFELFWGARSKSDLYMDDKVAHWQHHVRHFHYVSCLSNNRETTLSAMVIARHKKNLNDWQMVLSGPFDWVYETRNELVAAGVRREHLFSDAFSFEGET